MDEEQVKDRAYRWAFGLMIVACILSAVLVGLSWFRIVSAWMIPMPVLLWLFILIGWFQQE